MIASDNYIGTELEVFQYARNWKAYFGSFIKLILGQRVAEIGAGIGGTTATLCTGAHTHWLCVEPDARLAKVIDYKVKTGALPPVCETAVAYAKDLQPGYDSILYIDVIEHIKDDGTELETAAALLSQGGRLFIIVPAHQSLYNAFDQQIGHFRRYSRKSLQTIVPASLVVEEMKYLDSIGYLASWVNKIFLKQSLPSIRQVLFWDRVLVPISWLLDPLFRFRFGKSILLVARKQ